MNLRVEALIQANGEWNIAKLHEVFPDAEVHRITQLQVGEASDRYIWAFSSIGAYTVKGGYLLASKTKETEILQENPPSQQTLELKRLIWKVPTLPKIRSFLWRAASGALAIAERLNTRGMNLDTTCKLCASAQESISHVLFHCPVAVDIWAQVGLPIDVSYLNFNLVDLLSLYLGKMFDTSIPEPIRRSIPWILWTIWKNRNSVLYAETQTSIHIQIQNACEEARVWNDLDRDRRSQEIANAQKFEDKVWEPPIYGFVKCNIHANWRNASLHSGGAFILRDSTGNVLHHARDAFTFSPNRLIAELRGVEWALRSMKDLGYKEVIIASDLVDLFSAVKRPTDWPRFRILLQRIEGLCSHFTAVAFETESVSSNQVAREIAKSVLRDGRFQSYLAMGGPAWLHHLINKEAVSVRS